MNQRRHITLVAAGATVLAAMPLATVFEKWTWLVGVLIVVTAMSGTAVALRSVRAPTWAPTAGMIAAYLLSLTWLFGRGNALFGMLPTADTVRFFNELLGDAGVAIRDNGVPVGDEDGLLFLAALGIGAVLLAVDLAAVVARRPAIAGVPMVAIYIVPVGTHTDSVSFLTFACTAAAFLWLLATDNVDRVRRFGRRFTGDGRDVDVWEPSPLAAAGRRLAVVGVAAAILLPLAIPGMTTGLLDRFGSGVGQGNGTGSGNGNGRSGAVNLFSLLSGSLARERAAYDMVKVTTTDSNPFYLRFATADSVTAAGFVNRPWRNGQPVNNIATPSVPTGPGVELRNHKAQVEIVNFTEQILPVFQHPTKLSKVDNTWLYDPNAAVVFSNRANAKGKKYTFDYTRFEFSPEALRTAPSLPTNSELNQLTRLPDEPKVRALAEQLTKGKTTQYDKVRAIYDHFNLKNGFTYNTKTQAGNSGSVIVDFLNNKIGYCEQYAAAMGWLVRAAGIPARVAFGFTRGTNRNENTYVLTNYNLHAWTEVYFEGFGWVPFDATPASQVAGAVSTSWAPDPNQPAGPQFPVPEDDFSADPNASANPGAIDQNQFGGNDLTGAPGEDGTSGSPRWALYTLGGVVLAVLLLALPAVRRASLRRRRWPGAASTVPADTSPADDGSDPRMAVVEVARSGTAHRRARRDAHAAWDELVDTMIDFRVPVDSSETPRITADRLIRDRTLTGGAADGTRVLSRAEERARYARDPLTDTDLGAPLRAIRAALRAGVSRRTRLTAALFPPSVLLRWRADIATGYTNTVNRIGQRRYAMSRAVNPRRLLAAGRGR